MNDWVNWLASKDNPFDNSFAGYKKRLENLEIANKVRRARADLRGTGHHVVDCDEVDKLLKLR